MAWDINSVTIVGRLTRDPELSYTQSNTPVCKFAIASNHGKEKEDVSFFDVVAWNKTAEAAAQYLKKGGQVIVEGRLKQNRFTDRDGQKRNRVEIVANNVQFIGAKQDVAPERQSHASQARRSNANEPIDFEPMGEDEVPF